MGTPSGSKNCNILQDRLDYQASMWERPVYDTKHITVDADDSGRKQREKDAEKQLRVSELDEFRQAKSGVKIDMKLGKIERMGVKPMPAGPAAEKRKLPGFVRLKSKEDSAEAEAPDEKRLRVVDAEEAKAKPATATASPAPLQKSPSAGLVAYASDSSDEGA
mmetsp:Transcript_73393/g.203787  ORF Transcript_73393/g.203787 Transcript_73393/m.203787 type:complete len:163 (+) Transcript_73393:96-584(+)